MSQALGPARPPEPRRGPRPPGAMAARQWRLPARESYRAPSAANSFHPQFRDNMMNIAPVFDYSARSEEIKVTLGPADIVKVNKADLLQAVLVRGKIYLPRVDDDAIIDIVTRLPHELQAEIDQERDGNHFGFYHVPTKKFLPYKDINIESSQDLRSPPFEVPISRQIYDDALTYSVQFTP